jgi:acyl carrier protein
VEITSIRIKQIIAENLKVPLESISDDLAVGDIPEWDSLAHVRIIGALEIGLGVELDIEQTLDLEDVEDLIDAFLPSDSE